jgi:XTP/dITP diphosphohydrolase
MEKDHQKIKGELGDLMLHIVFYSKIASEKNEFNIGDVLDEICAKLVVRHPHIYSDVKADTDEDVKNNWEKIKLKEGSKSVLAGVPSSLPSLVKAYRIQEKARGVGFDWDNTEQVWNKVIEEKNELLSEIKLGEDQEKVEQEFGDLLFALINYSRFIGVNPEDALEKTNKKFIRRFNYIEEKVKQEEKSLHDMTLAEMDVYWNEAKKLC